MILQLSGRLGRGGAQRVASVLASGIAEQERRSAAVALLEGGDDDAEASAPAEVVCLGASRRRPATIVRAAIRLRNLIRREAVEAIHVHGRDCLPVAVLATRGLGAERPVLAFTWHDSTSVLGGGRIVGSLARASLDRCDLVYGSSRSVAERLRRRAGLEFVEVFRNGVPVAESSTGVTDEVPLIAWLGRLVPDKNPEGFLDAVHSIVSSGLKCRAVLAGDAPGGAGEYRERLAAKVSALGLDEVVDMPGWIDDPSPILRSAAITVQSSRSEGLSMALLEQMMVGLAVVATDVGDTSDVITDEETGLLVPPGKPEELARALERVVRDPQFRNRLGTAARARAVKDLSTRAMADFAIRAYDSARSEMNRPSLTSESVEARRAPSRGSR